MKHLTDDLIDKLVTEIHRKHIYLFLDYDGTLTRIVAQPSQAHLSKPVELTLQKLAQQNNCTLVIASGRELNDIKRRVGIAGVILVGNHGLEIAGRGINYPTRVSKDYLKTVASIYSELKKEFYNSSGVIVENKKYTLSVHYRMVDAENVNLVRSRVKNILAPYAESGMVVLRRGKKVLEIRPPGEIDKGWAVHWLLAHATPKYRKSSGVIIYIGDDSTDEDAFKALKGKGWAVRVGNTNKHTNAEYYVSNTKAVHKLLESIYGVV